MIDIRFRDEVDLRPRLSAKLSSFSKAVKQCCWQVFAEARIFRVTMRAMYSNFARTLFLPLQLG